MPGSCPPEGRCQRCGWVRQLHSYALLRGSFCPEARIATLGACMGRPERWIEYGAAHIPHRQKALMGLTGGQAQGGQQACQIRHRQDRLYPDALEPRCASRLPHRMLAALQVNLRDDQPPDAESGRDAYLKMPLNWF